MKLLCIAAAAATMSFATPSYSVSLTLTDVDGIWSSSRPTIDGLGSSEICWGRPAETLRSGYNFTSSPTPFQIEDQREFVIGQFSHENFPVYGTFLQSANLQVQFSIARSSTPITSTFAFNHLETLNTPSRGSLCQNGEANLTGLNASGCADRVTATLNREQSESFVADGVSYVLDILGFRKDGELLTNFWTEENLSNGAELVAIFRVADVTPVDTDPEPEISEVPLPASGMLILVGLASLAAMRRRL